jgi:sortase A
MPAPEKGSTAVKALRALAVLLLIAGTALTARSVYLHAKAELAGILIRRAWEESLRSGKARRPWPWADTHPIARLQIPRLGYDEIVLEGATARTLAFGPARVFSGAEVGEPGNLVLAGHRTSWFLPLQAIAPGDSIRIQWLDSRQTRLRERRYTVRAIQVVDPSDVTLLAPTEDDVLTLITCYPFGRSPSSPQRYVVRAAPVDGKHLAEGLVNPGSAPVGSGGTKATERR